VTPVVVLVVHHNRRSFSAIASSCPKLKWECIDDAAYVPGLTLSSTLRTHPPLLSLLPLTLHTHSTLLLTLSLLSLPFPLPQDRDALAASHEQSTLFGAVQVDYVLYFTALQLRVTCWKRCPALLFTFGHA
jgi:hypothetical protein